MYPCTALVSALIVFVVVGVCCAKPSVGDSRKQLTRHLQNVFDSASRVSHMEQQHIAGTEEERVKGCQCINYNCGCCVPLGAPKLHINTTACVNASYLPDQYGISLTLSIGKYVYINETISARNPPPICVGIPEFEKDGSVCLEFYDLDYSKLTFSGCIRLEARLFHVQVERIKIGCFSFPLAPTYKDVKDGEGASRLAHRQVPSWLTQAAKQKASWLKLKRTVGQDRL